MLLDQFSLTFEYRPEAQHVNADGLSRQCGQCLRPDCPVSSLEGDTGDSGSTSALLDQPFASSAMGDSMDADLLPELSGETWVAATYLDEVTADVPPAGSEPDLITASQLGKTLTTVWEWVQSGLALSWSDCAGLSPEFYGPGSYNLEICRLIRKVVYGVGGMVCCVAGIGEGLFRPPAW